MALYPIRLSLERNPNGVYTVTSPDVPGLVTEGSTASEIFVNVQDALEALKEAWQELGMEVPNSMTEIAMREVYYSMLQVSIFSITNC